MALSEAVQVACPYCGEAVEVEVDAGDAGQELFEDCTVCCRPMRLRVDLDADGLPRASAAREDE